MGERAIRLARNEDTFRQVNEQIEAVAARLSVTVAEVFEFLCECSDVTCSLHLPLSLAEYETVRSESTWFAVASGHVRLDVERVVEEHPEYLVVEKFGDAAAEAERLDPRP